MRRPGARRLGLAAATLGLLGPLPHTALAQATAPATDGDAPDWEVDSAILVYAESDGRVQLVEPVVDVRRDLGDDRGFSVKLVVDALTGASPNGAAPASAPQTFSRPSGGGAFTAAAGERPLDDTFRDTRVALSADYRFPWRSGIAGAGVNASKEYDFLSVGGSLRFAQDFNQKNTTASIGLALESDQLDPVGGVPEALSVLPAPGGAPADRESSESKTVVDLVAGVAQVIDANSVSQVNYSISLSQGYGNDPYKLLSVVGTDGEPLRYVHEGRPDSRTKQSLFTRYKRFVAGRDVVDMSYRFMADDWGIRSHTLDATYRWNFGEDQYLEPHLRLYRQSAADFYRVALFDGEELSLDAASADERLGSFDGLTLGLKYGRRLQGGNEWSLRVEGYRQAGDLTGVPEAAAAGLSKFNLTPELSVLMATFGYRFRW